MDVSRSSGDAEFCLQFGFNAEKCMLCSVNFFLLFFLLAEICFFSGDIFFCGDMFSYPDYSGSIIDNCWSHLGKRNTEFD